MSELLSPTIKRHYVAVTQHTLHAVRTGGNTIQFSDECALVEMSSSQRILRDWSEDASVSAIASVAPQPIWWQLVEAEQVQGLRSEGELRAFAARLPHGFRSPVEVIGCNAADGMPVSSGGDGHWRWLLGVVPGDSLADAAAETIERGIVTIALGASVLASVGAAATMVRLNSGGAVLLWHIGHNHSYVFTIGLRGVEAVTRCEAGFKSLLKAVQELLGLKSPVEAARHFFTNAAAVRAAAPRLADAVAPALRAAVGIAPAIPGALSFACTGLTNKQAWLGQEIARALGLPFWTPDLERYADHLQLSFATPIEHVSPDLLGTMHLAAAHAHGSPAWHPVWGAIGRITGASMKAAKAPESAGRAAASISATPPAPSPASVSRNEGLSPPSDSSLSSPPPPLPTAPAEGPPAVFAPPNLPIPATPDPTVNVLAGAESKPPLSVSSQPIRGSDAATSPTPLPPPLGRAAEGSPPAPLHPIQLPSPPPKPPAPAAGLGPISPPQQPTPAAAPRPIPPREPIVIVLHKRGYWPHFAFLLAVIGAAVSWKFYLDAEALKATASQEKTVAAEEAGAVDQEMASVAKQVTYLETQRDRAEKRALESVQAAAAEVERVRREAETTRAAAVAQARREAVDQTRRQLEPELEAARAAMSPGILKLDTIPGGAEVQIDNRPSLPAPVSIANLSPGGHPVKITLAGFMPVELTAEIIGSKTTDLGVIALERATGTLAVSSEPIGTDFSIRPSTTNDDAEAVRRGRTPARFDDLPPGDYVVQFIRAGWPDRTERVTVARSQTERVATTFESGGVSITSKPSGATVTLDGLVVGTTPLSLKDIPAREVTYELRANGYEALKISGNVVAGRELKLNGTLLNLDRLASEAELRTPPRPYVTTPLDLGRIPRSTPPFITVTFIVLRDGSLRDVTVLEKIDRKIAQRSVDAIAKWKFYPGVSHGGYPVNVRVSIPIKIERS
jgi:hypothetical protein